MCGNRRKRSCSATIDLENKNELQKCSKWQVQHNQINTDALRPELQTYCNVSRRCCLGLEALLRIV